MSRYLGTIQVMNNILPEDAIVGSWDAGRIGYFSDFRVVNLDGLANSYDYLNASKSGNGSNLFSKYEIAYFANILSVQVRLKATLYEGIPIRSTYEFKLWANDDTNTNGDSIWNKLDGQFDHQSNGTGVMLSDRLAQIIARDCVPDKLRDVVVMFSWTNGTADSVSYEWGNIHRNNLGYCVKGIELPREAMEPVRIVMMSKSDYARMKWGDHDYQWGDVGMTVEGRQVQVFSRDCDFERLRDMVFAASWDDGDSIITVGYLTSMRDYSWRRPCVEVFELPPNMASQVSIEMISKEEYANRLTRGRPPVVLSDWDIYLSDGRKLVYKKEACDQADAAARFFLHPIPHHRLAMPLRRWPYGFDNLDFRFNDFGFRFDDTCIAVRELPGYRIRSIRTGQYTGESRIWEANYILAK